MSAPPKCSTIVVVCLLAGVCLRADAQRTQRALSPEAKQFVNQEPIAVLQALQASLDAPRLTGSASCQAIPVPPPGPAHDRHYFLSEIGGCSQLACFLTQVPGSAHANATRIVDQACTGAQAITDSLVMPDRFTLAGVGIDGEGVLGFDLPDNVPAIRFSPARRVVNRMATIRDLNLAGSCCGQVGIDVSNSQYVYIQNVRVQGFAFGVLGHDAFSILIDHSSVHNNAFNIVMGDNTTSWRVRDSVASQGLIGIQMNATARGHVVSGGRVEANWAAGITIDGQMNVIDTTWFEGNGRFLGTLHGVRVTGQAQKTRLVSNLFSSQLIGDSGTETRSCFNMSFANDSGDVNGC